MIRPTTKKSLGQHFLRDSSVLDDMFKRVAIEKTQSIMEIGCGDGFLTHAILARTDCKKLIAYEIDEQWVTKLKREITDPRFNLHHENILETDWSLLQADAPLTLLANLPYYISFPIIYKIQEQRTLFAEGIIMVQEEVAQKLVATSGRPYGATSMFLQHHLSFELLTKIPPTAFVPPPKVFSRLVYFKPKTNIQAIPDAEQFWKFVKLCFRSPRQTIKNNLRTTHIDLQKVPQDFLALRAQQVSKEQFLVIWDLVR